MDARTALDQLDEHAITDLTILSLSAPYLHPGRPTTNRHQRTSNSSEESHTNANPSILAADLTHYRDLFSKLRFSYVEQVTKERFLRATTAQQPEFVDPAENAALQETLVGEKQGLKQRKAEVREIVQALEEQGQQLAGRYEGVRLRRAELEALPEEVGGLESAIAQLRQNSASTTSENSADPSLSLPLQPTRDLLSDRSAELESVDAHIAALQSTLPAKQARIEQLRDEVDIAQTRKIKAVEEAKAARRRREDGGAGSDELEERGRWLRGVETGLKGMLEV